MTANKIHSAGSQRNKMVQSNYDATSYHAPENRQMNCLECKTEFEAERSTAKFCSAKCRKLAFLSVPKDSVLDKSVLSVPEKPTGKKNVDGCVPTEHAKDCLTCLHEIQDGKKECGREYFWCGRHQKHIENYCEGMCYAKT